LDYPLAQESLKEIVGMINATHYEKAVTGPISFVAVGLLLGGNLSCTN